MNATKGGLWGWVAYRGAVLQQSLVQLSLVGEFGFFRKQHSTLSCSVRAGRQIELFPLLFYSSLAFPGNSRPANRTPPGSSNDHRLQVVSQVCGFQKAEKPALLTDKQHGKQDGSQTIFSLHHFLFIFHGKLSSLTAKLFFLHLRATRCLFIWLLTPVTCTRPRGDEIAP